jgi:NDP-sugar pyrophosphorylase family protein
MKDFVIVKNAIQCNKCGDTIESTHRHDFVTCSCGACSVDGGRDYMRRLGTPEDYTDVSEVTSQEEDDWFEKVRETFTWSSRGKLGNEPLRQILLKDLTDEHLSNIISTQHHIRGTHVEEYFKEELEYRKDVKNEL